MNQLLKQEKKRREEKVDKQYSLRTDVQKQSEEKDKGFLFFS